MMYTLTKIPKKKRVYKEPVFLFTSCSLRYAAWAGWYSAFGDEKMAEEWRHAAHAEWFKEIFAGRKFAFLRDENELGMWKYLKPEKLRELINRFLREIKKEIATAKRQKG